jgi:hypothetical protein
VGIYWNKDAKTEREEPRAAAKPKTAPRPRTGPPVSGTRAWTSAPGTDATDATDEIEDPADRAPGPADPNRARERGSGKG